MRTSIEKFFFIGLQGICTGHVENDIEFLTIYWGLFV
ncbi:hypothetical protein NRS6141_03686 [Bacillus subtilis]|nr:hypothetical protein NRS6141_03686 [Bacillus subtilis]CAF1913519.1 hypothetical protein NRS6204_03661 [Bacillus subtilis]CAF1915619.1 hypothetical protein NRS6205_03773 [Bacillus subtilis]